MRSPDIQSETSNTSWIKIVTKYNHPNTGKSWWQFSSNLLLYSLAWFLMFKSLSISYWITLGLSLPAAGMLIRLFIIYHDCGHGAFLKSRKARDLMGIFIGILTFTPYVHWTYNHRIHHDTAGNLDKRGIGDVWTMTVEEYKESSRWGKIVYRFYRHPITMFFIGAPFVFIIGNRFTKKGMNKQSRLNVYITNIGLLVFAGSLILLMGVKAFIMIQFPIVSIAGICGFWLFYVQHQFEPTYWSRNESWDYKRMALEGSSYYKLPWILQYFSGNIGFHHIHHVSSRIPNYYLETCHKDCPLFREVHPLTLRTSLKSLPLRLWDEQAHRLVGFNPR